jgi:hypothetical protein
MSGQHVTTRAADRHGKGRRKCGRRRRPHQPVETAHGIVGETEEPGARNLSEVTRMRNRLIGICMLLWAIAPATAQVSIGVGVPGVSIGINLPVYPKLVRVPGYPVYYAPQMNSNYFFYDGMYWVYERDNWYASTWYNGPWSLVSQDAVPLYILRVPVRYYRQPPAYFRGWRSDAPPRWDEHWGRGWAQSHSGWNQWNRGAVPAPAPVPTYQRQYSGTRYPPVHQQQILQSQHYRYEPRDAVVRQHYQTQRQDYAAHGNPASREGKRGQAKDHEQGDKRGAERNR